MMLPNPFVSSAVETQPCLEGISTALDANGPE